MTIADYRNRKSATNNKPSEPVSEIKRYDIDEGGGRYELDYGDYVLHEDHKSALEQERAKFQELEAKLEKAESKIVEYEGLYK